MSDLIERIKAATEGSRELDAEIHEAVTTFPARRAGPGWLDENGLVVPDFPGWKLLPPYTVSIDAALLLVPDGMLWMLTNTGVQNRKEPDFTKATALVSNWQDTDIDETQAATPALALCAAALKARSDCLARYGEDIFGDGK